MTEKRRKAIIRRRIFVATLAVLLAIIIALLAIVIKGSGKIKAPDNSSAASSGQQTVTNQNNSSVPVTPSEPEEQGYKRPEGPDSVTIGDVTLDAKFSRLLLVNAENPLPEDYDTIIRETVDGEYKYLKEIPAELRGPLEVKDIHIEVHPYITAMVSAARAEGIDLNVRSPFRTYQQQKDTFEREVADVKINNPSATREELEAIAATEVARPGTSEHNTGLCADFNTTSRNFEDTPMFDWLQKNAADYGFILRYPEDKQDITGVIYEPWHWRFVGINTAKEMNKLGMTLEEYVEYKNLEPTIDMYGDEK